MTNIEAKNINEEVLRLIELFESSDKKIAIIKTNNEYKLYDKEEIEQMEYEIGQLYEFTEKNFLIKLLKLQEQLKPLEEHKNLLNNVNQLELIIYNFGRKFYGVFKETPKDELFIKGKNAYLDCYKKPFATRGLDIKDVNNNESEDNKFNKIKINSVNLQNQPSTNEYNPSSQLKMGG